MCCQGDRSPSALVQIVPRLTWPHPGQQSWPGSARLRTRGSRHSIRPSGSAATRRFANHVALIKASRTCLLCTKYRHVLTIIDLECECRHSFRRKRSHQSSEDPPISRVGTSPTRYTYLSRYLIRHLPCERQKVVPHSTQSVRLLLRCARLYAPSPFPYNPPR